MDLTVPSRHRSLRVTRRGVMLAGLSVTFLLLTLGVALKTPLLRLDTDVVDLHLRERWPGAFDWINTYVMLGQRAPSTLLALPWFIWRAWRSRSWHPLVTLGVALLLLNLGVGFVKVATGRLGPLRTDLATAVFRGGDIYPSGHVSNAVVLYGTIAMLAVGHRRLVRASAIFVSVTVGLSTIYLDTHWLTDVVGGWLAGGMVLLAVPTLVPPVERGLHRLRTVRLRTPTFEPPPVPVPMPVPMPVAISPPAPAPAADRYVGAGG